MINTFIRVVILYNLVLAIMRFMGKSQISQMQPFELVIAIMIADLASTPMSDVGAPIFNGIVPILALLLLQSIISILNIKSIWFRKFVCGKPTIIIYKGKIDEKNLRKEKITINELQERLRQNNVFNVFDVEFAILETSGQVTTILKPEKRTVTNEDMNIKNESYEMSYDLIIDGKVMSDNLNKVGKTYNWLLKELHRFNLMPKDVLIATYSR